MKNKEHKIKGRKGLIEFTESVGFTNELPIRGGRTVHPVVFDIFTRLTLKPAEEALKFEFKDIHSARRFKYMLEHYRSTRKINAHVGWAGTTVYLYNKPTEVTNA